MRLAALILAGSALVTTAFAQNAPAATPFLPIPDMAPPYLFDPAPLSGTMLKPLSVPVARQAPEISPEPGPPPSQVASIESQETAPAAEAPAEPPAAAAPVEEAPADAGALPPPKKATKGVVTVIVENVESSQGTVNIAVCDTGLSREGCPYHKEIPAAQGFVETEFDDIPPGKYAVVGYHDVNGNNEFDKLFGMPREPYALSAAAADKLVPTFSDAALPINAGPNSVIIRLKRLGG